MGHVLVNAHLITPLGHFPVAFDLYVPAQEEPENHQTKIAMAQALIQRAKTLGLPFEAVVFDSWYLCEELASSLQSGLGKWVKDHAASIGAMCRQAAQDTVRCLILWVVKVAQTGMTTDALMSILYGHPKLQVADSG